MRILVVEDEPRLANSLQKTLTDIGHQVKTISDGQAALADILQSPPDLILLDVNLPGADGITVASELRRLQIWTPILMLTGKSSVTDKVQGLDAGADVYMTKPFAIDELLAQIRALLRRCTIHKPKQYAFGDLVFSPSQSKLICGPKEIQLNYKEASIIQLLLQDQSLLPKEELVAKVWGYHAEISDNNVEAYISFLRRKLRILESAVIIKVVKKQGYRLEYAPEQK